MPRTKIIATLGPASSNYATLRKMFTAGLDVVRLNFSHGSTKKHLECVKLVRKLNSKYKRHIRIMQDLEGFRIRVGRFKGGSTRLLKKHSVVWLKNAGGYDGPRTIPLDYAGDLRRVRAGNLIYIDDGNLVLKARSSTENSIKAQVLEGGVLRERKGINIPDAEFEFKGLTDKDKKDIKFGIEQGLDYIALSFVNSAEDVAQAVELVKPEAPHCQIVAKIETRQAIANIDEIIERADGIMIARGDMGISVPVYKVPVIQKQIIKKCNAAGKFVITATEMLEHMTEHPRPTRAEVADVANAILDGTDFVMLSAETAIGRYPYESVMMMNEIIKFTEKAMGKLQILPSARRKNRCV